MCEYMIDSERGFVYRLINGVYIILCTLANFKMGSGNVGYFEQHCAGE